MLRVLAGILALALLGYLCSGQPSERDVQERARVLAEATAKRAEALATNSTPSAPLDARGMALGVIGQAKKGLDVAEDMIRR